MSSELAPSGADSIPTWQHEHGLLGNTGRTERGPHGDSVDFIDDPLLQRTSFDYDLAGRVTQQTLPDLRVVGFGYDPSGNVVAGLTNEPLHRYGVVVRDQVVYVTGSYQ